MLMEKATEDESIRLEKEAANDELLNGKSKTTGNAAIEYPI